MLFDYDASRAGRVPVRLLGDYAGCLVTDGDEGYADVVRKNGITHAGCWTHARRKFVEAQKVQPKGKTGKADWALNQIRKLYAVEKQASDSTFHFSKLCIKYSQNNWLIGGKVLPLRVITDTSRRNSGSSTGARARSGKA